MDGYDKKINWERLRKNCRSSFFQFSGIKLFIDGALGSRGALLKAPYNDDETSKGLEVLTKRELRTLLVNIREAKLQTAVHSLGDQAVSNFLDVCEEILPQGEENEDLRFRVEHLQVLDPVDIIRMKKLKMIASFQGLHFTDDYPWLSSRLGDKRLQERVSLWNSCLREGVVCVNGTDAPIASLSPIESFWSLITRTPMHKRFDVDEKNNNLAEAVTREQALTMMTSAGAYGVFAEKDLGAIVVGKMADAVLLSKNILECSQNEIPLTEIVMTIIGGEVVFEK
jgi:hypothetical protein